MRHIAIAMSGAMSGVIALSGCTGLLTPSGSAAARWERLEQARAEKAAGIDSSKVCKNMTVMGSNFPQRVCSTQAEWDAFDKEQRQSADDFDAARRAGNTGSAFERGGQR